MNDYGWNGTDRVTPDWEASATSISKAGRMVLAQRWAMAFVT